VEDDCFLVRHNLTEDMMKSMTWTLSKIAHSFIKIKQLESKDEEYNASQNLLKSKILSGGIQNRFLSTFSKETCHTIENLATITGDKKLVDYLSEVTLIEEDDIFMAIIHEGTDSNVDRLIDLLQWNLCRKNPAAKVGGSEGNTVSRCAFASNLALNQNDESCSYNNFCMMVDTLEISMGEMDESTPLKQRNKELMEELESLGGIEGILERFSIAAKMRIWLQEKRKDISNSIKKKADAERRRKEDEEKLLKEIEMKTSEDIEEDEKKPDDEDTIDTSSVKTKIEHISNDELLKREKEQIDVLVKKVSDKAELLIKLATPPAWNQPDTSSKNLINVDMYNDKEDILLKDESLAARLQRIRTIQASSGTITSYENLSNKDIFNSCASSVLATLQCSVTAKSIMKAIESKYISAMNRYCGLKIMGELASCYMGDETKISCFNWFCSALRHNTNILAHYSDDLTGMGDYLLDKCRISFFDVYNGIVKQIKTTPDKDTIEFLLNSIKWRIGATDHQYILNSGIIQVISNGNGQEDREKNPIKYCWGHLINYKTDSNYESLSHMVLEALEFIMMACFARILGEDEDKNVDMNKTGSSVTKLQQAYSVVNTNITEVLLATSFEIIFNQLNRYTKLSSEMAPIDYKLYVSKRTEMRKNGEIIDWENSEKPIEDEKTEEDIKKELEEEKKEIEALQARIAEDVASGDNNLDLVSELLKMRKDKEMKKLHSLYDDKVILKLLRLLEVFTAIALKNNHVHQFVMQVARPAQVFELTKLLLNCRPRQGTVTLKIFSNLIKIGVSSQTLDDAFVEFKKTEIGAELLGLETKVTFEDCPFLQFFYNLLYSIRSSQWDKRRLESYGSYNISSGIVKLFQTILRHDYQPAWKKTLEKTLDNFIANIDSYPIQEFDVLISLFEGGEYNGMNIGAYGKTQDGNKFITVGFVQQWYDLTSPNDQNADNEFKIREIESELSCKEDCLLAIYYDDKHPERNDMFLAIPDEVTLISNLHGKGNDYLLDKTRLNNFLKAMEIDKMPDKNDSVSLTKRCVGMKILVEHIELYGEKIAEILDESFRDSFINYLLKECSKPADKDSNLKCEWYDQKLYAIKKLATESQTGLMVVNDTSMMFNNKMMSITTIIEGNGEQYSKCYKPLGAINYGMIPQKLRFKLIDPKIIKETGFKNDNIVLMKGSDIDTAEKITEIFKHVDVIVTSDLDLIGVHDKIKEAKKDEFTYFKSIVLLDSIDFDDIHDLLANGPKVKLPETKGLDEHETMLKELELFCNFERSKLEEIFKDNEKESLSKKVNILTQACKENKQEDKKEDKKKDEEEDKDDGEVDQILSALESNSNLNTNLSNLSEFANNNYDNQAVSSVSKGALYDKAYNNSEADVMGTYKTTLAAFYKQLCKKTISSFFEQLSLEKLLEIILKDEENFEMFLKYIQIRANEAVKFKISSNNKVQYEQFLTMFKKILEISAQNKDYIKLIDIILNKVIIEGTAKILKTSATKNVKDIKKAFEEESAAVKALNTYLIPDTINYLLTLVPEMVYKPETFTKLVSILLMIPITFRDDKEFHQNMYMCVYKLILPYIQEPEKYNDIKVINELLNHKFLTKIFGKLFKHLTIVYRKTSINYRLFLQ
jgi:hypothetical protein